jgi:hypothetical protein
MDDVGIFYGHLVNFLAFWCILWTLCIICGHPGIFPPCFGILYQEKSGNPALECCVRCRTRFSTLDNIYVHTYEFFLHMNREKPLRINYKYNGRIF